MKSLQHFSRIQDVEVSGLLTHKVQDQEDIWNPSPAALGRRQRRRLNKWLSFFPIDARNATIRFPLYL